MGPGGSPRFVGGPLNGWYFPVEGEPETIAFPLHRRVDGTFAKGGRWEPIGHATYERLFRSHPGKLAAIYLIEDATPAERNRAIDMRFR